MTLNQLDLEKDSTPQNACQVKNGVIEENMEQSCKHFDCPHNIFWSALFEDQRGQKSQWKATETVFTKSIHNCMLLLDEDGATIKEIAKMYGITFQSVAKIVHRGERKLRSRITKEEDFFMS